MLHLLHIALATCASTSGVCINNPSGHVAPPAGALLTTVDDCCAACTAQHRCKSWTSYADGGDRRCALHTLAFNESSGSQSKSDDCVSGAPGARKKRPNFVLYFPDTLRAESHSGYGVPLDVSPNLAKFAKGGVQFDQAHVMHTQCAPSRATMLTGRYMHVLGHRTQTHLIQDYEPNYFRALKEAGYHVEFIGKNDAFSADSFNLSVSRWTSEIGYASGGNAFEFPEAGYFSFLSRGSNKSGADPSNGDYKGVLQAVEWMKNGPPEPFVLFLPSRGAHPPYGAPKEWHSKFTPEQVKAAGIVLRPRALPNMPTYMGPAAGIPHHRNLSSLPVDFFYKILAVYLGMIAYTDWCFGQLLAGLDAADGGALAARTAVFFSSDHGDFGGDYGLVEKWPGSMADVLTRVPLVARLPGGAQGVVSRAPVQARSPRLGPPPPRLALTLPWEVHVCLLQTADILETMLDLAGVNASWVRFGASLRRTLESGAEGDLSRHVYCEGGFHFANEQAPHHRTAPRRAAPHRTAQTAVSHTRRDAASCSAAALCRRSSLASASRHAPRASTARGATRRRRPTARRAPRWRATMHAHTRAAHVAKRAPLRPHPSTPSRERLAPVSHPCGRACNGCQVRNLTAKLVYRPTGVSELCVAPSNLRAVSHCCTRDGDAVVGTTSRPTRARRPTCSATRRPPRCAARCSPGCSTSTC